ncbi:MAG: hypothetical protein M1569_03690 [Candidatus Marsarchaeota archaeon]|nr:hypothetical protein [Candidatus Marsarchaeota archaeon]MCL5413475.1 hypothetical protein [Candidatus Marsarchaeota archaeon]
MDMWNSYIRMTMSGFGTSHIDLKTGARWNASIGSVVDKSRDLPVNNVLFQRYDESSRYILAKDITFDLFFSIYDVNSRSMLAARVTNNLNATEWSRIFSMLRVVKVPNFEFRLIGLQDGHTAGLGAAEQLRKRLDGRFVEFDLFGTNTRHIAIDAKTGVPYDLLLLNRAYRAGELACQAKREDFEAVVSPQAHLVYAHG